MNKRDALPWVITGLALVVIVLLVAPIPIGFSWPTSKRVKPYNLDSLIYSSGPAEDSSSAPAIPSRRWRPRVWIDPDAPVRCYYVTNTLPGDLGESFTMLSCVAATGYGG